MGKPDCQKAFEKFWAINRRASRRLALLARRGIDLRIWQKILPRISRFFGRSGDRPSQWFLAFHSLFLSPHHESLTMVRQPVPEFVGQPSKSGGFLYISPQNYSCPEWNWRWVVFLRNFAQSSAALCNASGIQSLWCKKMVSSHSLLKWWNAISLLWGICERKYTLSIDKCVFFYNEH